MLENLFYSAGRTYSFKTLNKFFAQIDSPVMIAPSNQKGAKTWPIQSRFQALYKQSQIT